MQRRRRLLARTVLFLLIVLTALLVGPAGASAAGVGGTAVPEGGTASPEPVAPPSIAPDSSVTGGSPATPPVIAPIFAGSPFPMSSVGWVFPLYPLSHVAPRRWWSQDQGVDLGGSANQCGPHLVELAVAS